jgi:hypothetical protein
MIYLCVFYVRIAPPPPGVELRDLCSSSVHVHYSNSRLQFPYRRTESGWVLDQMEIITQL